MSRSYRKPWIKEHQRNVKTIHNRRERRIIKQLVKKYSTNFYQERSCWGCECGEEPWVSYIDPCPFIYTDHYPPLPSRREMTDSYSISDYRFPWTDPQGYRK